jgi:hypothetical protein
MIRATRRRSITGMRTHELAKALREYGVDARCMKMANYWAVDGWGKYTQRLTVTQWVNERAEPGVTYIVAAGGHFMTVRDRKIICNQQPEWKSMAQRKGAGSYKRARVTSVIEIS